MSFRRPKFGFHSAKNEGLRDEGGLLLMALVVDANQPSQLETCGVHWQENPLPSGLPSLPEDGEVHHGATAAKRSSRTRPKRSGCAAWCAEEGLPGVLAVVIVVLIFIYLFVIFLLHETPLTGYMVGERDALLYLGVYPTNQVFLAIILLILTGRLIRQVIYLTCWRKRLHKRAYKYLRQLGEVGRLSSASSSNASSASKASRTSTAFRAASTAATATEGFFSKLYRIYKWQQRWLGATGPYFAWWCFAKEVFELVLQNIALVEEASAGVDKGFLQFHASVIALNSFSAIVLTLPMTARRVQISLIYDSFCDCCYGMMSVYYVFLIVLPHVFSESWMQRFCVSNATALLRSTGQERALAAKSDYDLLRYSKYGKDGCNDLINYVLLAFAKENLYGSDSAGTAFLKLMTRLVPLWNAIGRTKYIVIARQVEQYRAQEREQEGTGAGGRRGSARKSKTPKDFRRQTSFFSRAPTVRNMDEARRLPWPLAALFIAISFAMCIFVFVRVEHLQCPTDDEFWRRSCAAQSFPLFHSSPPPCTCHTLVPRISSVYPGCRSSAATAMLEEYLRDPAAAEYLQTLYLNDCNLSQATFTRATSTLTSLRSLVIWSPRATGPASGVATYQLSPDLGRLSHLHNLAVSYQRIAGAIPDLSSLTALRTLVLDEAVS